MKKIILALMISVTFTSAFAKFENTNSQTNLLKKATVNSGIIQSINGNQGIEQNRCVQKTFQVCLAEYNTCLANTPYPNWNVCFQQFNVCGIECL